jgi:hypothetical protein
MFDDILQKTTARRDADRKRFESLKKDLCQLCHAHGPDKRSLFIECFYVIQEAIPEAIDLHLCGDHLKDKGYYLRICKSCRAVLLMRLRQWRNDRVALREQAKSSDGYIDDLDGEAATIPVRIMGETIMMTPEQFEAYKEDQDRS